MSQNSENKKIVKEYYDSIYGATADTIGDIVSKYFPEDAIFDAQHPINHLDGRDAIVQTFYKPLLHSFPDIAKHSYIFMGGRSVRWDEGEQFAHGDWVCASGYYEATFENDYLGIPANGGIVLIRFCEYNLVKDGKIAITRTILDLLDLMRQVGISFFKARGLESFIPGPRTFDGIMMNDVDPEMGENSIKLIEEMCFGGLNSFEDGGKEAMGLGRYFHKDFSWYGPCGIGICKGLKGFEERHQMPWLDAFPDRHHENFFVSLGEGSYGSIGGWPSTYQTHTGGGFLGIPATGKKLEMRCIDWWRIEDGLIVENWVHIDMPHLVLQMGLDIFKHLREGNFFFKR